ncbi:MAG: DUF3782 domain-containing protein [Calditrichaeota bacterium]|nr:MAG: DUF3782 domain-containing protein [Calditrichota bacterium]
MSNKNFEKSIQEIWNLFKETDRRLDERFKETDRRFKETDRRLDKLFKETARQLRETNQRIDALTGKWGRFVEGLLIPAVERLFKERGIEVKRVFQRARSQQNGLEMEIDILAVNEEYVVAIEAKSTLGVEDIKEHLHRLSQFKAFFPEYANRKIIGAVAGIVIEEGADRFAYKTGLFVIGQSGETVRILNDKKFVPRTW